MDEIFPSDLENDGIPRAIKRPSSRHANDDTPVWAPCLLRCFLFLGVTTWKRAAPREFSAARQATETEKRSLARRQATECGRGYGTGAWGKKGQNGYHDSFLCPPCFA